MDDLTTHAETLLQQLPPQDKPIPDFSRFTYDEIALVLKLREQGLTQTEIAARFGCSQSSVSDLLLRFQDTRPLAILRARNLGIKVTEAAFDGAIKAAGKGHADAALELIDRLEVLAKRQEIDGRQSVVNIVIGMPNQPAGPDPFKVNVISNYQTRTEHVCQQTQQLTATQTPQTQAKVVGESHP